MLSSRTVLVPAVALVTVLLSGETAAAARVRYHYVPSPGGGPMTLAPVAPGFPGERLNAFGRRPHAALPPQATWMGAYRHPFSGATVQVPLGLPFETPTVEHRNNRLAYNYGSYLVEVIFLPDGSVDVVYSNGLFRDI